MKYENKFGTLIVEPVTDYQPVSSIKGADVPEDCFFGMETAEEIVLITDNRMSQVAFVSLLGTPLNFNQAYLIIHESANSACVVRVVSIEYKGKHNPQREIDMAKKTLIPL